MKYLMSLFNRPVKPSFLYKAKRMYEETLKTIDEAEDMNDLFMSELYMKGFYNFFKGKVDANTHHSYYNEIYVRWQKKEMELLGELGVKQLN